MGQPSINHPEHRLDSWKEIAAFFARDERTVRRWEKESSLPVHRVPGIAKGRVYAYESELRQWLNAPLAVANSAPELKPEFELRIVPLGSGRRLFSLRTVGKWAGSLALVAALTVAVFAYRKAHRFAVDASETRTSLAIKRGKAANPEAEDFYLKGRYYWNKRTPEDLSKALDYFMQAVVHDPNYAQAYVGLADCYNLMREYTLMPSSEAYPRALAAAKKAVELDPQSSEAHASLAFVSFFGTWDVATGEREFRRAIELNPSNPAPHQWYANALLALHRLPDALAEIDRAQALDPASTSILADKGNILSVADRQDEAIALLKQLETREPGFRSPHDYLRGAYLRAHDYPNYLAELRKDALLVRDDRELAVADAADTGFSAGGARGMFEAELQVEKKLYAQNQIPPTALAQTFAVLGNKAEALRYLKIAYEQRDSQLLFARIFCELDSLHDEPAYHNLLVRMNLPI
jgi:Tfp pilus assembly protein PilF